MLTTLPKYFSCASPPQFKCCCILITYKSISLSYMSPHSSSLTNQMSVPSSIWSFPWTEAAIFPFPTCSFFCTNRVHEPVTAQKLEPHIWVSSLIYLFFFLYPHMPSISKFYCLYISIFQIQHLHGFHSPRPLHYWKITSTTSSLIFLSIVSFFIQIQVLFVLSLCQTFF